MFRGNTMLPGSSDKCGKQRMRRKRLRFELGMKLAAEEPGMVGRLDDLDVGAIGCAPGDAKSRVHEPLLVIAIEFVAVPVPLAYFKRAVSAMRERTRLDPAGPRSQTHRAAHLVNAQQLAQLINHAMLRL